MTFRNFVVALCSAGLVTSALAQGNPDYRVKADFRTPNNGQWASNESIGNADFRVHSRFLAVYYGGVLRQDDFDFSVQIDFSTVSGFDTQFTTSPYNTDYDMYINNQFVGRVPMGTVRPGLAELTYKSRHPTLPELPVPANWPSPISPGSSVTIFAAGAGLPQIGDPMPGGSPIFPPSTLEERFDRGDANHDGHVDMLDYAILAAHYDPGHLLGPHVGPATGDFSGDSLADAADYDVLVQNWDSHNAPPAVPQACINTPASPVSVTVCAGGPASFATAASGTGPFSYQWRRNGVAAGLAGNASSRTATLMLSNVGEAAAGTYDCLITNGCGTVSTSGAELTVRASFSRECGGAGCDPDLNQDGNADQGDIDYLIDVIAGGSNTTGINPDINLDGNVDQGDIDALLNVVAGGACP